MNFEQFQQSRRLETDLGKIFGPEFFDNKTAGFVYDESCYIEIRANKFWTMDGYIEFESHDLSAVEKWLFNSNSESDFCRCGKLNANCDC